MAAKNPDLFANTAMNVREDAVEIIALFLAQSNDPKPPHIELGYATQRGVFEAVGKLFAKNWHTVKLTRDAFDRHTGSGRVGWEGELRPALAKIFDKYSDLSRSELLDLSKAILAEARSEKGESGLMDSIELFRRIETDGENTKTSLPMTATYVEFSNTGRRSDGWFVMTIEQIAQCLKDIIDNNEDFDSLNRQENGYEENSWRTLFEKTLTNRVARTMGKVQSLPLFELLAKIIHFSNTGEPRNYKSINTSPDWIRNALEIISRNNFLQNEFGLEEREQGPRETGGENILFYGAPGTGKSHDVWEMVGDNPSFATVFHPDMQNSDFAGTLKPRSDGMGGVGYAFSPGQFARAVACAWENPSMKVFLVIEELNRAVAAAVFGELFQLLDRKSDGSGRYEVDYPSPEFADWFEEKTGLVRERLSLPSNLWILATMNSADQGVYPLDTAFRRRWRQRYLPLDYSKAPEIDLQYATDTGIVTSDWRRFVKALNNFLVSKLEVEEDRLIGPRFLDEQDLSNGQIPSKLLNYLWDDLLRHHGRIDLFDEKIRTYGELDKRVGTTDPIFSRAFLATLGGETATSDSSVDGQQT